MKRKAIAAATELQERRKNTRIKTAAKSVYCALIAGENEMRKTGGLRGGCKGGKRSNSPPTETARIATLMD